MGGIGNVVMNTVVRMFTRKAVGKAMKAAKAAGGKRGAKKAGGAKRRVLQGRKGRLGGLRTPTRRQERNGQQKRR